MGSPAYVEGSEPLRLTGIMAFMLPEGGLDLKKLEVSLLRQALARTNGNKTRAGRLLGLSRDQVRYRLERHGIVGL